MSATPIRSTLLRSVLGLTGPAELTDGSWTSWRAVAATERMIPQLHHVARRAGSDLDAAFLAEAEVMHLSVAALAVRMEKTLLNVAGELRSHGIEVVVLKGLATCHLDHADPGDRQFGDIDVLILPADFDRAVVIIGDLGWRSPAPSRVEEFEHALTLHGPAVAEIDLHRRVAPRALGLRIPTQELFAGAVPLEIAGQRLLALGAPDRLIHAGVHAVASKGSFSRLSSLADVLLLSRSMGPTAVATTLDRADGWRVRTLLDAAVRQAHEVARVDLPGAWVDALRPHVRGDRLIDRAYLGAVRRPLWEGVAHLRAMRGWSDRVRYVAALLGTQDSSPSGGGVKSRVRYLWNRLTDRMDDTTAT